MRSQASFLESAAVAFDSLRSSKLRSVLTLLGIILSTTTLIAVIAVIHGMDVYVANSASNMGTDGFRVLKVAFVGFQSPKDFLAAQHKNPELTREEYGFVKANAKLVREVGISANRGVRVSYAGDVVDGVGLQGVTSNALIMSNTEVDLGRMFTDSEDDRHSS